MAKKVPAPPAGAPEWMVTYGDMVTLLMCFFVLLFAMSSLETAKMSAAIDSLNEGFGLPVNKEASNIDVVRGKIDKLDRGRSRGSQMSETPEAPSDEEKKQQSQTDEQTDKTLVPPVDAGTTKGYILRFHHGVDGLDTKSKSDLRKIKNRILINTTYKIMLKGYSTQGEFGEHDLYRNGKDLAYTRAVNVQEYLVSLGMKEKQFQILVLGDEPFDLGAVSLATDPKVANSVVVITLTNIPVQN